MAVQGFDWACIDMEHAALSPAVMAEMVAAVASSGTCVPVVRVPSHAPEWFRWALDAGAHAVIVPAVNTADELAAAQRQCRYPPAGARSAGTYGASGPRSMSDYAEPASSSATGGGGGGSSSSSSDIMVIPQIESVQGVRNLPSILKVGGTDAVFVGPYSLGASVRAAPDMHMSEVMAHIEKCAKEFDVPLGIYASTGAAAGAKLRDGYTLVVAASDVECLTMSAAENLDRARNEARHFY